MTKNVLTLCNDNSSLSIMAQAILNKNLSGINVQSAAIKKSKPLNKDVKKALIKDGSFEESYHSKSIDSLGDLNFDLVIVMSQTPAKKLPEFGADTAVIEIEYEEPNYSNSTNIERFLKTIKMELIPITRDILEL